MTNSNLKSDVLAKSLGLSSQDMEDLQQALQKAPHIYTAKIFGSRAMGNYKPASDIDLVVFGELSVEEVNSLQYHLNEETCLPYRIDVLCYQHLNNEDLKGHIDQHSVVIYQRSL